MIICYRYRPFMEERSYRDRYRERSNERSHERRDRERDRERGRERDRDRERNRERDRTKDRDRSRERRDIPHYIKSPIPVPIYYGVSKIYKNLIIDLMNVRRICQTYNLFISY